MQIISQPTYVLSLLPFQLKCENTPHIALHVAFLFHLQLLPRRSLPVNPDAFLILFSGWGASCPPSGSGTYHANRRAPVGESKALAPDAAEAWRQGSLPTVLIPGGHWRTRRREPRGPWHSSRQRSWWVLTIPKAGAVLPSLLKGAPTVGILTHSCHSGASTQAAGHHPCPEAKADTPAQRRTAHMRLLPAQRPD